MRKLIHLHDRFENGAGIHSAPPRRSIGYGNLILSVTDFCNYVIEMPFERGEYSLFKFRIFADCAVVQQPRKDVFSAPHIPSAELLFYGVGRKPAVFVLPRKHIFGGRRQNFVQLPVTGITVYKRRAAHKFAEIFAAPALVFNIFAGGVNLAYLMPDFPVFKLMFEHERYIIIQHTVYFYFFDILYAF